MSKPFTIGFGIAAVLIAFLIWRGFVETKGNHLEPTGKIGKIRAEKVDDNEMIVISICETMRILRWLFGAWKPT